MGDSSSMTQRASGAVEDKSKFILASASPRRRELLSAMGINFTVLPADIDETRLSGELAEAYVLRLATEKVRVIAEQNPQAFVLGADTTVVLEAEGSSPERILEKPVDKADACAMLRALQGRSHIVLTAFAICSVAEKIKSSRVVRSQVWFSQLDEQTIQEYVRSGEPMDKAGAYGVQGIGSAFVERIEGSYTNVVGLPLSELLSELRKFGIWTPTDIPTVAR